MAIIEISDQNFEEEVQLPESGVVLVDFWAPWCNPCKMLAPILDEVNEELGDQLKIAKVNVDHNPNMASKFGVMSIPTLIIFKGGQQVAMMPGLQRKEQLLEWVGEYLQEKNA